MVALYRTTQNISIPLPKERKIVQGILYIEVFVPKIDTNSNLIFPQGNYYTKIDEQKIYLDSFRGKLSFSEIKGIEDNMLPDFTQNRNVIDVFLDRIKEFTLLKIDMEFQADNAANWGINSSILEEVV